MVGTLDLELGRPMSGLEVTLRITIPNREPIVRTATTDDMGRAVFEGLVAPEVPAGSRVRVEAPLDYAAGLQIRSFWDGEEGVCVWQPDERHQGWAGITCGGIIATLIDCHCMATAMAAAVRREGRALGTDPQYRFATGRLDIRFLKPTPIDRVLELRARVTDARDERKFHLDCALSAGGVKTAEASVVAVLVYRSDDPQAHEAPFGLGAPQAP